jgi:hypothetical protein
VVDTVVVNPWVECHERSSGWDLFKSLCDTGLTMPFQELCRCFHVFVPMMKKLILILPALFLTSSLALGSGLFRIEGKGGSGYNALQSSNYDIGKRVFFQKLHCASCPLSDLSLNQQSVASIMPSLDSSGDLGKSLSYRERSAVQYFLEKRFNL